MDIKEILKGTYGDQLLPIHIFNATNSSNILINIHGSYGDMYSGSGKYRRLANRLVNDNVAHVVLYQSTRENTGIQSKSYEDDQMLFKNKTFHHELADLLIVLNYINENSRKIFVCDKPNIILNGNSLGAVLGLLACEQYKNISYLNTVGGGIRQSLVDSPILRTYPKIELINKALADFKGILVSHYGTSDNNFTEEQLQYMYKKAKTKRKYLKAYEGVDHGFKQINGVASEKPYDDVINYIVDMLKGESLPSANCV